MGIAIVVVLLLMCFVLFFGPCDFFGANGALLER